MDRADRRCDFDALAARVAGDFWGDEVSIHGPGHWRRVERNGIWLGRRAGADLFVVRLFAWFHDSRRINDGSDPGHGGRGAQFAGSLRGDLFEIDDLAFGQLIDACQHHTDGTLSDDVTIGTCWDADRHDLGRVGLIPDARFMSTSFGKEVAEEGSFFPFLDDREIEERFGPSFGIKQRHGI